MFQIDPLVRPTLKDIVETLEKTIDGIKADKQSKKKLAQGNYLF